MDSNKYWVTVKGNSSQESVESDWISRLLKILYWSYSKAFVIDSKNIINNSNIAGSRTFIMAFMLSHKNAVTGSYLCKMWTKIKTAS